MNVNDFLLSGNFKEGMTDTYWELKRQLDHVNIELAMEGYLDGWTIIALKERQMHLVSKMNECIDMSDRV